MSVAEIKSFMEQSKIDQPATVEEFHLEPKNLSRTLEDAGTCAVPLVPWSVAGTYMAATLGVPTLSYLP